MLGKRAVQEVQDGDGVVVAVVAEGDRRVLAGRVGVGDDAVADVHVAGAVRHVHHVQAVGGEVGLGAEQRNAGVGAVDERRDVRRLELVDVVGRDAVRMRRAEHARLAAAASGSPSTRRRPRTRSPCCWSSARRSTRSGTASRRCRSFPGSRPSSTGRCCRRRRRPRCRCPGPPRAATRVRGAPRRAWRAVAGSACAFPFCGSRPRAGGPAPRRARRPRYHETAKRLKRVRPCDRSCALLLS